MLYKDAYRVCACVCVRVCVCACACVCVVLCSIVLVSVNLLYGHHRDIVKLTAQFVAKNGTSFLESSRLMQREQRSYQFDFLRKHHPLFSYFTKLVEQYSKVCACVCIVMYAYVCYA